MKFSKLKNSPINLHLRETKPEISIEEFITNKIRAQLQAIMSKSGLNFYEIILKLDSIHPSQNESNFSPIILDYLFSLPLYSDFLERVDKFSFEVASKVRNKSDELIKDKSKIILKLSLMYDILAGELFEEGKKGVFEAISTRDLLMDRVLGNLLQKAVNTLSDSECEKMIASNFSLFNELKEQNQIVAMPTANTRGANIGLQYMEAHKFFKKLEIPTLQKSKFESAFQKIKQMDFRGGALFETIEEDKSTVVINNQVINNEIEIIDLGAIELHFFTDHLNNIVPNNQSYLGHVLIKLKKEHQSENLNPNYDLSTLYSSIDSANIRGEMDETFIYIDRKIPQSELMISIKRWNGELTLFNSFLGLDKVLNEDSARFLQKIIIEKFLEIHLREFKQSLNYLISICDVEGTDVEKEQKCFDELLGLNPNNFIQMIEKSLGKPNSILKQPTNTFFDEKNECKSESTHYIFNPHPARNGETFPICLTKGKKLTYTQLLRAILKWRILPSEII